MANKIDDFRNLWNLSLKGNIKIEERVKLSNLAKELAKMGFCESMLSFEQRQSLSFARILASYQ